MKIQWKAILPHVVAVLVFFIVTIFFFNPIFFDNRTLEQPDIQQFRGSYKSLVDYRATHDDEPLWAPSMFSGMPAYMISVHWSESPLLWIKTAMSLFLPHPVGNIYLAFLCFYIMLIVFGIRPYLAIAGALAFGLSSYMIIGLSAGHNSRIGAIAFLPLMMAGIHLTFSKRKILGFGLTATAFALHLRENHLQITYYFIIIVGIYGLIKLTEAAREKTLPDFAKTVGILVTAVLISAGTFFGQFWAVAEYTKYSTRGKSELPARPGIDDTSTGLSKERAFYYSNGILEPMVLLIPNFYGGSSGNFLVSDRKSDTFNALQDLANNGNEQLVNQLYQYTRSYWGPQVSTAPYYAGAITVFLFVVGILFAERKYVWWLVSVSVIGIVLSWGSSFSSFNYFLYDYLPGYSKFRSVTFTMMFPLFAMPLLGLLGIERLWSQGLDKKAKQKLLIAFGVTGGFCLLLLIFAGMFSFITPAEEQLPAWFTAALASDRKGLLQSDAFRSFAFIAAVFILLYFDVVKKISTVGFYVFLIFMMTIDLSVVDKRYFSNDAFKKKRDNSYFAPTEADQVILQDKSYFRVYNLQYEEARTSYFHYSIGGYHGAKMRRYQDLYDSCIYKQTQQLITDANKGKLDFPKYSVLNMLNVKYIVFGTERTSIMQNAGANGNAWFVRDIVKVNSPADELEKTGSSNTKTTAVIDASKFPIESSSSDSSATIRLTSQLPNLLQYESQSQANGLAVFSEIYYPEGWIATIDGKEVPIVRADYILRALEVPAGSHKIEFKFQPAAFMIGDKVTAASCWLVLLVFAGTIAYSVKKENS